MKQTNSNLAAFLFSLILAGSVGATPALAGITDTPAEDSTPAPTSTPAAQPPAEAKPAESKEPAEKPKKEKKAKKEKKKAEDAKDAADEDVAKQKDHVAPGGATDKKTDEVSDDQKTDDAKADAGEPKKKARSLAELPGRVASVLVGAPIGFPIMMVKRTVHQTKAGNRDFIGESTNPLKVIPATIISLPFGAVGGFLEGWQYSIWNGWTEEPFSKESMSLED